MLCPSCQHNNPDDNRFCGKCGALLSAEPDGPSQAQSTVDYLQRVAREHPRGERPENPATPEGHYETQSTTEGAASSDVLLEQERERSRNVYQFRDSHPAPLDFRSNGYPREGYDEAEQPVVELQPELIEFDNRIPLIAEPGMDRRKPEWRFREPREKPLLEPQAEDDFRGQARLIPEFDAALSGSRKFDSSTTTPRSAYYTDSIFGLNTPGEPATGVEQAKASRSVIASEEVPAASQVRHETNYGNRFLDFSETTQDDRTSLHGPSFLGLEFFADRLRRRQ